MCTETTPYSCAHRALGSKHTECSEYQRWILILIKTCGLSRKKKGGGHRTSRSSGVRRAERHEDIRVIVTGTTTVIGCGISRITARKINISRTRALCAFIYCSKKSHLMKKGYRPTTTNFDYFLHLILKSQDTECCTCASVSLTHPRRRAEVLARVHGLAAELLFDTQELFVPPQVNRANQPSRANEKPERRSAGAVGGAYGARGMGGRNSRSGMSALWQCDQKISRHPNK